MIGQRVQLRLRFGIDDEPPQTQAAVGRRLGLTPAQVRSVEQRALSRLAQLRELEALSAPA